MKLIVGLGNPGREYRWTRHNAGFLILDALAAKLGTELASRKFAGRMAFADLPAEWRGAEAGDGRLLLAKPQTFMNLSGETVAGLAGFYKLDPAAVLVVVDDVDLPLGRLRIRRGGSAGGHKGLRDIEARWGTGDYPRLRMGVGGREAGAERRAEDLAEHVLSRFAPEEEESVKTAVERAVEACLTWAGQGTETAMNRFNAR
jgi:PTH1 family peptidyl-tRNA hydrolase